MTKEKSTVRKEMEYAEAPSGYVTMYNYKEPFMIYESGYGFQGVLLFDKETDNIQCHICGKWFGSLANHLAPAHAMTARAYKEMVGLSQTTALINEHVREKLIATGMQKRMQNLVKNKGKVMTQKTKDKISRTLQDNVTELRNKRGTCPEQLIHKLRQTYIELGRTPSEKFNEVPHYDSLISTFGTFQEACRVARIPYRIAGSNIKKKNRTRWTDESIVEWIQQFYLGHDRLPTYKDFMNLKTFGLYERIRRDDTWEEYYKKALDFCGINTTTDKIEYNKDYLAESLKRFKETYKRNASKSDCRRGMLPPLQEFTKFFGSWNNALTYSLDKIESSQQCT